MQHYITNMRGEQKKKWRYFQFYTFFLHILDALFLDFGDVKSIFFLVFSLKIYYENNYFMKNKLEKIKQNPFVHPVLHDMKKHLKIYHKAKNVNCYICIKFLKNYMNLYKIIKVLFKIVKFSLIITTSFWHFLNEMCF